MVIASVRDQKVMHMQHGTNTNDAATPNPSNEHVDDLELSKNEAHIYHSAPKMKHIESTINKCENKINNISLTKNNNFYYKHKQTQVITCYV